MNDHLFGELAKSLRRLAGTDANPDGPGPAQIALLAYHLAHALQLAASSSGGVEASLEYLQLAAAFQDAASSTAPEPTTSILLAPQ